MSMTSTEPSSRDGCFMVRDNALLTRVPANITVTPATDKSAFIGATSEDRSSRHVFPLGLLEGYKFMCLFRFKIWWMIPSFGDSGCDVPAETQMLLLEATQTSSSSSIPDKRSQQVLRTKALSTFCYCQSWMEHSGLLCKATLLMSLSFALKAVRFYFDFVGP
ncbi:probable galactinol--sucrose galactosyltransferase 2 [Rosa chinensis]|uniref:probable galactinol--sucrose galactosyltransferase 2 n=1 Tax=Rosa chinensis TaxID=74649 RepID=UPI001AD900C3|nr:probable galactinol--sucrose galactosyltransferase 2 [Rosa chinensis]